MLGHQQEARNCLDVKSISDHSSIIIELSELAGFSPALHGRVSSRKGVSSRLLRLARPCYGETLLEICPGVAFLLRRQLSRGTAGHC
jgi:hypothetical protein